MSAFNKKYDIIQSASTANFTAYTYEQIYATQTNTITVNDTVVDFNAGDKLDLRVKSIASIGTGGTLTGIYLIGSKADNWNGSTLLG